MGFGVKKHVGMVLDSRGCRYNAPRGICGETRVVSPPGGRAVPAGYASFGGAACIGGAGVKRNLCLRKGSIKRQADR